MPDHPRRKVRRHINLLKEFNSPVAACLTSAELMYDITLQREEEDEAMPAVHERVSTDENKLLLDVVRKFDKLVGQGQTDYTHIVIETGDSYPKNQPPYRMDQRKTVILDKEVKTLLHLGIIRPSKSLWAAPVILVNKKDGSHRLCVDYRCLNNVTKPDPFPLPRIDELLEMVWEQLSIYQLWIWRGGTIRCRFTRTASQRQPL